MCINYRKLNKATKKDHFPLPFIDEMLERRSTLIFALSMGTRGSCKFPFRPCSVIPFPAGNAAQPTGDTRPGKNYTPKEFLCSVKPPEKPNTSPNPPLPLTLALWTPGTTHRARALGKNPGDDARARGRRHTRRRAGGDGGGGGPGEEAKDGLDGDPSQRRPSRRHLLGSGSGVQVVGGGDAGTTFSTQ
jgi:hypothetical protein